MGRAVSQLVESCATGQKVKALLPDVDIEVFIDLVLPAARCSWVGSACNRNEYQDYYLGVKATGA